MNLLPTSASVKVWVFQAENLLSDQQKNVISSNMNEFLPNWKAHQIKLDPGFEFVGNLGFVVYNDEINSGSSGCSIDKLIHNIKIIEDHLNINLFNRMGIILYSDGEWVQVSLDELIDLFNKGALSINDNIINQAAISADQLIIPLKESWVQKYLKETVN